jgi:hypothetical protein
MSGWLFTYAPLIASCVSILALIASSLSLGWNIHRDVVLKPRLRVTFGIKSMMVEREQYRLSEAGPPFLTLQVTNLGPGEVVCSSAVAKIVSFPRSLFTEFPYGVLKPDSKHPLCFPPNHRLVVGDTMQLICLPKGVFARGDAETNWRQRLVWPDALGRRARI